MIFRDTDMDMWSTVYSLVPEGDCFIPVLSNTSQCFLLCKCDRLGYSTMPQGRAFSCPAWETRYACPSNDIDSCKSEIQIKTERGTQDQEEIENGFQTWRWRRREIPRRLGACDQNVSCPRRSSSLKSSSHLKAWYFFPPRDNLNM